ncbi:MAG: DUF6383 domain-containing protein [Tannerellaceae bacterium]|nr:DUF6383 domain-containing protein [Tannerellaceae bacterium]
MKKKFFTLIAGLAALASLAGTASAQSGSVIEFGTHPLSLDNEGGGKYQMLLTTKKALETILGPNPPVPNHFTIADYPAWASTSWVNGYHAQGYAWSMRESLRYLSSAGYHPSTPTASSVLYYGWIDKNGELRIDPVTPWGSDFAGKYHETIFCVTLSQNADQGRGATLDISSWAHKFPLLIDPDAAQIGGDIAYGNMLNPVIKDAKFPVKANEGYLGNWGYSNSYGAMMQHWLPIYTYVPGRNDSVYIFVADFINNTHGVGPTAVTHSPIKIQKLAAADLYAAKLPQDALLVEFIAPAPVALTADGFNTKLGSMVGGKSQRLVFKGDGGVTFSSGDKSNLVPSAGYAPWRDVDLTAIDVAPNSITPLPGGSYTYHNGISGQTPGNATDNWLYFKAASGANKDKFLYLDTAYYGNANPHMQYAWSKDTLDAFTVQTHFTIARQFPTMDAQDRRGNPIKDANGNQVRIVDTLGLNGGGGRSLPGAVSDFINQYRFQVRYFWENDSLAVDIAEANLKPLSAKSVGFFEVQPYYWAQPTYAYPQHYDSNAPDNGASKANEAYANNPAAATHGDYLHVKLVDLVKGQDNNILTVGDRTVNTRMKFDMKNCSVQDNNLASIPEGVYIIRNVTKNMLLQVPVYSDTTALWVTERSNVDPMRMPSYQWIVKKVNPSNPNSSAVSITNREFPNVGLSSLRLYNGKNSIVFTEEVNASYSTKSDWNRKDCSFQHVSPDALNDKWLGYFHIDNATARISKFDLNYYNQFLETQSYFIGKNPAAADTSLEVSSSRGLQFAFVPQRDGKPRYYGYVPTRSEVVNLGVDTMWRVAYELKTKVYEKGKPVEKILVINKEHKYVLSSRAETVKDAASQTGKSTFLFKANNRAKNINGDEVDFFAMLDTTSSSSFLPNSYVLGNTGPKDGTGMDGANPQGSTYDLRYVKLGVPEDSKWIYEQVQDEQRTSAFAVTSYTPPLYRRFDNGKYKAFENETLEVTEPFGNDNDSPLYLKFTRQNNYGYEFLAENSPLGLGNNNPGGAGASYDSVKPVTASNDYRQGLSAYGAANTSFLGYYNREQYPEQDAKLSYNFYVDTAYSRRPAIGSTSTAFTPKPQYMLALRAQAYPASKIIYDGKGRWNYPDGSPVPGFSEEQERREVDIPAFTTGFYLYNAQDSASAGRGNDDFLGKAGYGGQGTVRLAFVRGFHVGDSFYVIPGEKKFAGKTDLDIILDKEYYLYGLPGGHKHYLGVNDHFEERTPGHDYSKDDKNVAANNGKAMVFQFRLIKDELGNRPFMIETQTADPDMQYGPDVARWLRIENGVPFLTDYISFYEAAGNPHNGADIFNVEKGAGNVPAQKDQAASSEQAAAAAPKVIGGTGSVTILNAAGKTITVTNVLGQTIAVNVAAGNSETIALPKGVVVVSVNGSSTKALVK